MNSLLRPVAAPVGIVPNTISPAQLRRAGSSLIALGLWAGELAGLAGLWHTPARVTEAAVGAAVLLLLPDLNPALRLPLVLCAAALAVLTRWSENYGAIVAGLDFAGPLGAFLVAVGLLRAVLGSGARVTLARGRLDQLDPVGRRAVFLLVSFVLSAVFLFGSFSLMAPLVSGSDRDKVADAQGLAAAALCGSGLAFCWSPFSVGTAFATGAVGVAAGPGTTGLALAVALGGVLIGLAVHGRIGVATLTRTAGVVQPLLLPLGAVTCATLVAALLLSVRVTQAVVLVAPLFCTAVVGSECGTETSCRADVFRFLRESGAALKDLAMYAVGFALAKALAAGGGFAVLTQALMAAHVGPVVVPGLVIVALVLALAGAPALVCASLVAGAALTLLPGASPAEHLLLALYAWTAASMLSLTSVSLMAAAGTFGASVRDLVLGRNLVVLVVAGGALSAALTLLS